MTQTRWDESGQEAPEKPPKGGVLANPVWALLGIAANAAGFASFVANPTPFISAFIAVVAVALGTMGLWTSYGKPVGVKVILSVAVIVAGSVLLSVIITRAVVSAPTSGDQKSEQTAPPSTTGRDDAPVSSPASTPATSSQAPPVPAEPGVARASGDKPIALTSSYALDLDSREPYWIAKPTSSSSNSGLTDDLSNSSGYLSAPHDLAYMGSGQPTLDDCIRAPYKSQASYEEAVTGAAFCVKTSGGTYGRVTILQGQGSQLMLDVVVWKKPY